MVDSMSVKTTLSQIDHVQRIQHVRQKESDVQQKQFHTQLVQQTGERLKQVSGSPKTEHTEIRDREGGSSAGNSPEQQGQERSREQYGEERLSPEDRGSVIDVKV